MTIAKAPPPRQDQRRQFSLSPPRPRQLYQYDWEQPQEAHQMTFAIEVPALHSGPRVPIPLERIYKRQYWGYTDGPRIMIELMSPLVKYFIFTLVSLFCVCLILFFFRSRAIHQNRADQYHRKVPQLWRGVYSPPPPFCIRFRTCIFYFYLI